MLHLTPGPRVLNVIALICAFAASAVFANDLALNADSLAAEAAPVIATQPLSQTVKAGSAVTLFVVTRESDLAYQWKKDGFAIAAATRDSFEIASAQRGDSGNYTVDITNPSATTTSSTATLEVSPVSAASVAFQGRLFTAPRFVPEPGAVITAPIADGFARGATGGGNITPVIVTTAAEFKTQAESSAPAVITVSGTIDLRALPGVSIKSDKTIQGQNAAASIDGQLFIGPGVSNVIIRGLNLTYPTVPEDGAEISPPSLADFDALWSSPGGTLAALAGTGGTPLIISGASRIYVTHCSFFDAEGYLATVTGGADNVTFSWCEFYYQPGQPRLRLGMLIGAPSGETKPLHITLHHNWWSDLIEQRMPVTTYGHIHQYSNYFKPAPSTPNVAGTEARASSQLLSERNLYHSIASPLTKSSGGLIRTLGNTYTATTGTAPDTGSDNVFVPPYSYATLNNTGLPSAIATYAGNTAGALSASIQFGSMSIAETLFSIPVGGTFTLQASLTNIAGATYQWRLDNTPIPGATAASYTVSNAQLTNNGTYTATITLMDGDTIVSSPKTIALSVPFIAGENPPASNSGTGGGGGGGSPSVWFLIALTILAAHRIHSRK
ncbi:hypothetical protein CMV30_03295 [Nibricoccus aquaticus]|uniref:Ig-like domain-containing protein n=1 Tax=Nibricoccus aquaticus TaxID=2576891 RepID=A0A290QGQ1_9BACT|nr:hypothetical protein [Nibricoccus aquaticus]ATC63062.1 hypothetical protein CMV30_03295 [Nibricoccus aquaticus]